MATETAPSSSGTEAATTEPKTSTSRIATSGNVNRSTFTRSSALASCTSKLTAALPTRCVSSGGAWATSRISGVADWRSFSDPCSVTSA